MTHDVKADEYTGTTLFFNGLPFRDQQRRGGGGGGGGGGQLSEERWCVLLAGALGIFQGGEAAKPRDTGRHRWLVTGKLASDCGKIPTPHRRVLSLLLNTAVAHRRVKRMEHFLCSFQLSFLHVMV